MKQYQSYILILVFLTSCLLGCKTNKQESIDQTSTECTDYYAFIKNNWIENDGGWFEFKDVEQIYQVYDTGNFNFPFTSDCLTDKSKPFIKELFGQPNRELVVKGKDVNSIVYCFNERCVDTKDVVGLSNSGIIFFFDEKNILKDYHLNKSFIHDYRKLDRKKD